MCEVYCVIPECVGGYLVVISIWEAWIESVSECSSQVQEMRSPLVIVVPFSFVEVHCSGKLCMRVLMCVSVLLSAWVGCAYVVWVYVVVVGLVGGVSAGSVGSGGMLFEGGSVGVVDACVGMGVGVGESGVVYWTMVG